MGGRFDLTGRVIIVTGGGKGIGKVYSEEMARAGARVVSADIDGDAAIAAAAQIREQGGEALGLRVDISDPASCDEMAGYLSQRSYSDQAIKRAQVPDDLVGAVMFFVSAASDFISGQTLNIDGGKTMH